MGITEQAIGLGWRFDPLERRDVRGRWTRGGSAVSDLPPGSFRRGPSGESVISVPGQMPRDDFSDLWGGYEDSPEIPADPALTKYVQGTVDQIPKMLGGGHEVWNGKVVTQDVIQGQDYAMAALDWHGTMRFKTSEANDLEAGIKGEKPLEPDDLITPLHELIHGNVSPDVHDYQSQADAYQNRHTADIEEGFTQLGAIQHYGEYVHRLGLDDKPTHMILPGAGEEVDKARSDLADSLDAAAGYFAGPLSDVSHETVTSTRKEAREIRQAKEIDTNIMRFQALGGGVDEYADQHPDFKHYLASIKAAFDALDKASEGHTATQRQYAEIMNSPGRIKDGTSFNSYPDQVNSAYRWVEAIAHREQSIGKIGKGETALHQRILELANQVNQVGPAGKADVLASQLLAAYGWTPRNLPMSVYSDLRRTIREHWGHSYRGGNAAMTAADVLILHEKERQKDRVDITPRTKYDKTVDAVFGGQADTGDGKGVIMSGHKAAAGQEAADLNSVIGPDDRHRASAWDVLNAVPPNSGESPAAYGQRLHDMSVLAIYRKIENNRNKPAPPPRPFPGWKIESQHNIKAQAMSDRINAVFGTHVNAADVINALPPNPGETPDQYGRRLAALGEGVVLRKIHQSKQFSVTSQAIGLAGWQSELRGYHGEWMGRDVLIPSMKPADGRKPLDQPGRVGGAGTPDDPVDVQGDMSRAVDLMIAGKHVRLSGPEELPALADEINRRGDAVGAGVGSNPPWDLGNVSVRGTRLFNEQTTGIERANMPQLAGPAEPGSEAALLAGGANKFFIADPEFRHQLERDGISVRNEQVPADELRATQAQLTATTVTGIARAAAQGSAKVTHMLSEPIWVTEDNYVIDGHHRWAAGEVLAAMQHNFPGRRIEVQRIGLPVAQAIPYANRFAARIGIATKALGGSGKLVGAANVTEQAIELGLAHWLTEKRGYHGKWVGGQGVALQTLGIKSRKGWIRVPDRPTQEQMPEMLRPKSRKQVIAALNMLGAMTAAQGPKQASLMGKIKGFLSETAAEGGAATERPVPEAVTSFADASAGAVDHLYGGGHETFNGQVTEGSTLLGGTKQSGALAYLDWDGSMHLRGDVAGELAAMAASDRVDNPGPAEVILHELTHGVTDRPGRSGADEQAYRSSRAAADAEEGFTELGATFHARQFFEQIGIAGKPTQFKDGSGHELTVGEVADRAATREAIMGGTVWNDYPGLTKRAYLWAERVAQQRGVPMSQVVDEINRLGTASKLDYIARAGVPWA